MNLEELREKVKALNEELKKKQAELASLRQKIKTATDEELGSFEKQAQKLADDIAAKIDEQAAAEDEVKAVEDELQDISKAGKAALEKRKNEKQTSGAYLKTKQALTDFAKVLLENPEDAAGVQKAWEGHLRTKNITNPEILVPEPVAQAITDAFDKSGTIFATFNHTGLTAWRTMFNTEEGDAGLARGHKRGVDKQEQSITLDDREIRAQYIYKYITLDKETIRENSDTGALLKYVLEELPQRVVMEIEKAAIIGDGRAASDDAHIKSYTAITEDTDQYMTEVEMDEDKSLVVNLVNIDAEIEATGKRYLVMHRRTLADLKVATDNNGALLYPIGTDMAGALGVNAIFTPQWFPKQAADQPIAVEYVGEAYRTVGDKVMESFENFILAKNKHEYLAELYSGGALSELHAAAVLMPPVTIPQV